MSRCHLNRLEGTKKPRTRHGLGKGSHSPFQRVVEPSIGFEQIADERMGFVRVSVCGEARGQRGCLPSARPALYAPVNAHGIAPSACAVKTDPLPPYPTPSARGTPRNFSPTFSLKGLSHVPTQL